MRPFFHGFFGDRATYSWVWCLENSPCRCVGVCIRIVVFHLSEREVSSTLEMHAYKLMCLDVCKRRAGANTDQRTTRFCPLSHRGICTLQWKTLCEGEATCQRYLSRLRLSYLYWCVIVIPTRITQFMNLAFMTAHHYSLEVEKTTGGHWNLNVVCVRGLNLTLTGSTESSTHDTPDDDRSMVLSKTSPSLSHIYPPQSSRFQKSQSEHPVVVYPVIVYFHLYEGSIKALLRIYLVIFNFQLVQREVVVLHTSKTSYNLCHGLSGLINKMPSTWLW